MREINAEVFSKIQDHIRKAQEVSAEVLREEESLARNNAILPAHNLIPSNQQAKPLPTTLGRSKPTYQHNNTNIGHENTS